MPVHRRLPQRLQLLTAPNAALLLPLVLLERASGPTQLTARIEASQFLQTIERGGSIVRAFCRPSLQSRDLIQRLGAVHSVPLPTPPVFLVLTVIHPHSRPARESHSLITTASSVMPPDHALADHSSHDTQRLRFTPCIQTKIRPASSSLFLYGISTDGGVQGMHVHLPLPQIAQHGII